MVGPVPLGDVTGLPLEGPPVVGESNLLVETAQGGPSETSTTLVTPRPEGLVNGVTVIHRDKGGMITGWTFRSSHSERQIK